MPLKAWRRKVVVCMGYELGLSKSLDSANAGDTYWHVNGWSLNELFDALRHVEGAIVVDEFMITVPARTFAIAEVIYQQLRDNENASLLCKLGHLSEIYADEFYESLSAAERAGVRACFYVEGDCGLGVCLLDLFENGYCEIVASLAKAYRQMFADGLETVTVYSSY